MDSVIAELLAAPEFTNEASLMAARLDELIAKGALTWKRAQGMSVEIATAAQAGLAVIADISSASRSLRQADAQAAKTVPVGF